MIVMKFGGTSVASAKAIHASRIHCGCPRSDKRQRVVVVSAMGKTTDKLLDIASRAISGHREEALRLVGELEQFHLKEGGELDGTGQRNFSGAERACSRPLRAGRVDSTFHRCRLKLWRAAFQHDRRGGFPQKTASMRFRRIPATW